MTYTILDPRGTPVVVTLDPPAPLRQLGGARIGVLDNSKDNAGVLLRSLRDGLVASFGALEGTTARKDQAGIPAEDELIAELATANDLVLVGTAD